MNKNKQDTGGLKLEINGEVIELEDCINISWKKEKKY